MSSVRLVLSQPFLSRIVPAALVNWFRRGGPYLDPLSKYNPNNELYFLVKYQVLTSVQLACNVTMGLCNKTSNLRLVMNREGRPTRVHILELLVKCC